MRTDDLEVVLGLAECLDDFADIIRLLGGQCQGKHRCCRDSGCEQHLRNILCGQGLEIAQDALFVVPVHFLYTIALVCRR